MGKYDAREWRMGEWWIGQRANSPAFYAFRYDADKRQNQRISLGTTDFEQAKERLIDLYHKSRTIKDAKPAEISMAEVLARYWELHGKAAVSATTVKAHLGHWLEFHTSDDVATACAYGRMGEFKRWLEAKGFKPSTINHVLSVGRAACRMAWKRGEITAVPPFELVSLGEQAPMGRPLTVDELKQIITLSQNHIRMLLVFLVATAARPSAILELEWSQVSHDDGMIYLNPQGRAQNKKRRPAVCLPDTIRHLHGEGFVVGYKGTKVKSVKTSWRKLREKAGMGDDVTLYSVRHTVARWMRLQGVPMDDIRLQLGHAAPPVTARYIGYAPDYLRSSKVAIDGLLAKCLPDGWDEKLISH